MKKVLLTSAALAAIAFGAGNAGLANATPTTLQPGFYVGLNAGVGFDRWQRKNGIYDCCGDFTNDKTSDTNFTGGGQVGFNWVPPGSWMFGIEGDFQGSSAYKQRIPGTGIISFDPTSEASFRSPWLSTIRGRVGFQIPNPNPIVLYATGGFAFGKVDYEINDHAGSFTDSKTLSGWTAGLGAEMAIADQVSVKVEYLYVDLGTKTFSPTGSTGTVAGFQTDVHPVDHEVRIGLNWHF